MTLIVAVIILLTKFTEGAWVIVIVIPLLVWALYRLNRNYEVEEAELEHDAPRRWPPARRASASTPSSCSSTTLDVPAAQALQYARSLLPDDLMAMHIDLDPVRTTDLVDAWGRLGYARFPLEVVDCPDRRSDRTAAEFVAREMVGGDTDVTVLIPRRVYQRYWHRLVHDNSANTLAKALDGPAELHRDVRSRT